jgi:hypothetical protein
LDLKVFVLESHVVLKGDLKKREDIDFRVLLSFDYPIRSYLYVEGVLRSLDYSG